MKTQQNNNPATTPRSFVTAIKKIDRWIEEWVDHVIDQLDKEKHKRTGHAG